ncbi:BofC C-terminal domain-containing protein [Paenibacillus roseipurpureus]|uniref:BofC C-terminal domain-containing protein n=1 Tax=Paenibacillus roseopurpureus TaxID=2918901 RepID=A0AA96LSR8_9BACL|nr:BofC C-terminal domain-containing protein [Paenibacillus sp. MBLB1832]WNR45866.1 BofC C-terminal domain-containing protein [Paenibacillus sp. MBLB1832]
MNVHRFLKQLKRRLRWKRSWLMPWIFILVVFAAYYIYTMNDDLGDHNQKGPRGAIQATLARVVPKEDTHLQEAVKLLQTISDRRESYLLKSYVCGEERSPLGSLTSKELLGLQKQHPDWKLSIEPAGAVIFTEQIDDLSPDCKEHAVFGIDGSSNLSLFNGLPANKQIIRTFFQLNIQQLESSLPRETIAQLHEGIKVSDIEEYNSVLSTFSDYAIEAVEGAISRSKLR